MSFRPACLAAALTASLAHEINHVSPRRELVSVNDVVGEMLPLLRPGDSSGNELG